MTTDEKRQLLAKVADIKALHQKSRESSDPVNEPVEDWVRRVLAATQGMEDAQFGFGEVPKSDASKPPENPPQTHLDGIQDL